MSIASCRSRQDLVWPLNLVGKQRVQAEHARARVHLALAALRRILRDRALDLAQRDLVRGAQLTERRRLAVLDADEQLHAGGAQAALVQQHDPLLEHLAPVQHALDLERDPAEQLVLVHVLVPRQHLDLLACAGREVRP
eukprot:scaffold27397_cov77-Phaeocystis_antarctica.AAC.3